MASGSEVVLFGTHGEGGDSLVIIRYKRLYPGPSVETVGTDEVNLPSLACAVEVSLTRRGLSSCPANAPRFLAIADTGFTHTLLIQQALLERWGGFTVSPPGGPLPTGVVVDPIVLDRNQALLQRQATVTTVDASGATRSLPAYTADLWLHPFRSRTHLEPLRIPLTGGFVLFPTPTAVGPDGPPLPLLGALAMQVAQLKLTINYAKLDFSIQEG
jgi:hypothetical protein